MKIFLLLFFVSFISFAQQRATDTQYLTNPYLLHPALTGNYDYGHIAAGYRMQGLNNSQNNYPTSFYVAGHSSIKRGNVRPHPFLNKHSAYHSVGGMAYQDQTSPIGRLGVYGTYAYSQRIKGNWRGAIGFSLGVNKFTPEGNRLYFSNPTTAISIDENWKPDGSIGFWLNNKHTYLGGTIQQLFQNSLNFDLPVNSDGSQSVRKLNPRYFLTGGVKIDIAHNWSIEPFTLLKFNSQNPFGADLNLRTWFKDQIWLTTSYRNLDSFAFTLGFVLWQQLEINYMYDYSNSANPINTANTHELGVGFRFWPKCKLGVPLDFW